MGFGRLQVNGSINCVSASSPVAAVTSGGIPCVSSGSTSASRGIIPRLRRLAFTPPCSGDASTAFLVASEPVPAVVGIASSGSEGLDSGSPRPTTSM
jgi:hypothetical protein